jgi:ectoine hydroxylase-related dioxygenase (phytanoyl-CoA dioxygenase family)
VSDPPRAAAATASKRLTPAEQAAFNADGYLAPVDVLGGDEVAAYRAHLEAALAATGGRADARLRNKPHLLLCWMAILVRDARVLDALEDLLGPDLLVLRTTLFVKTARDPGQVTWHQDTAYWDLSDDRVVTAWIALTDSTTANGCVRVVRGSHRDGPVAHHLGRDRHNQLLRGQIADVAIAAERVVPLELRAGQMSLHHGRLLHSSPDNPSDTRRAGLAVRYISPEVRAGGPRQSATLVRGVDRCGHFDHEPAPRYDFDPVARAWHARSLRRYALHVMWQIARRPSRANLALLARVAARAELFRAMR